jgi:phosphohistidine swiveling domain-containing protein
MREPEPSKTMSQSEPRPLPLLLSFDEIAPMHLPWVGSKAYNLSRMMAEGFPVPSGFCLTTHAFPEVLSKEDWESLSAGGMYESPLHSIRDRFVRVAIDPSLISEIEKHLTHLGPGLVAVRSSATAEDLPDRSSAGQYESILDVQGFDACDEAIRKCLLSLWSDRAYAYRKANGIDHATARMAVIVQRMIAAEVSGIAFTADPITGNRDHLVVEAAPGPGEAIVQGRIVPDRILIDNKSGDIIHQALSAGRTQCCLATESIRELSVLAAKVEDLFGCPQDIEWSIQSGRIWLLQARPITALPDAKKADWDAHQIWSNVNAGEVIPDVVTPMMASVLDDALCDLFGQFFRIFGLEMDPMALAGRVAGRYYFNVNAVIAMLTSIPGKRNESDIGKIFGGQTAEFEKVGLRTIDPAYLPPARLRWGKGLWGILRFLPSLGPGVERRAERKLDFVRRKFDAVRNSYRQGMDEGQLCSLYTGTIRDALNIGDMSPLMAVTMVYSSTMFHLCKKWLGDENLTLANQLMAAVGGLEDAQSGFDLWDLAKRAADDPRLLEVVQSGQVFDCLRTAMSSFDSGRDFLTAWDSFMDRHGHLCRGEIELANPRWAEQPDRVLDMLRSYLPDPEATNPHKRKEKSARRREELLADCLKRLNPFKRWIFSWVARKAQLGSRIRENVKNRFILAVAVMRRVLLELGQRLTARGILSGTDDIFFVLKQELDGVVDGTIDRQEIRRRIANRRREYDFNRSLNPPSVLAGRFDPAKHVQTRPDPSTQHLNGLAVSTGVVTGPARVILHASDDFVRPGEILVAPFTDPGWTPYFVNAAGIVMDQGGLLSHGSIVAREFGIPCVVNVGPATQIIQTGRTIRVDGNTGTVYLTE